MYMAIRIMEREVGTLSNVLRDEMVKTSSSEALQQNRQFLASLTVPQVYHTHTHTHTHTRAVGDGTAGAALAAPVFLLLSTSVHVRIISLAVALKYVVSKDSYRVALSICSSESEEYVVSGIVRQLACNGGITLEQPPTKIAFSAR